ncbi:MAG TPA: hypothetical protein VGL59_12135 [Polyangia bacterium]|jgi:hypothetical protein
MRSTTIRRTARQAAFLGLLFIGCGEAAAPFDELPLRDALRADPAAIAAMPDDARLRLGQRLEAARTEGQVEPLLAGSTDGDGRAHPFVSAVTADGTPWRLQMQTSPEVAAEADAAKMLESQALDGAAGALVKALLAATGAQTVRRVIGWPIGAVAIGDTVYVNAAWLVALAPGEPASPDAGALPAVAGSPGPSVATMATVVGEAAGASPSGGGVDAGAATATTATADDDRRVAALSAADGGADGSFDPPPQPPPVPDPQTEDGCASIADGCAACASTSHDGTDACASTTDDSSDPCGNTSGDGTDDCANSGSEDDAQACANSDDENGCEMARAGHRRKPSRTHAGLFLPLGYLLLWRRR